MVGTRPIASALAAGGLQGLAELGLGADGPHAGALATLRASSLARSASAS